MAKIKFALLKDVYELPDVSAMKKALKVKKISAGDKFENKTADWVAIEHKRTFAFEVVGDFDDLFNLEKDWGRKCLYAFSEDANSTMLSLIYPNHILALFTADDLDVKEYLDAHWARATLERFAQSYENDGQIDFILEKLSFNKSQINKLNSFKQQDKTHYNYVMELRNIYSEKMRKIVSTGWD